MFQYSEEDGGFPLYFDIPLYSINGSEGIIIQQKAINNGYFDIFTKSIIMDAGLYSSSMERACHVKITAAITAAGSLQTYLESRCFQVDIYPTSTATFRVVLEIAFVALTLYYLIIELLKLINSISNERLKLRLAKQKPQVVNKTISAVSLADKTLETGARTFQGLIKGILAHIQNVWSFLDVAMLALIIICIVKWCLYFKRNSLKTVLNQLTIQPNQYVIESESDLAVFRSLIVKLADLSDTFEAYYRSCAIAGLIIILKILKYMTSIFKSLREFVSFVMSVVIRILPFIVLLVTILMAFSLSSFYFYGSVLQSFSTFEKSFFYTMQNILQNYDRKNDMSAYSYGFTFTYFATFSFIVIFIMSKMFLIYTMAEYRKFVQQRDLQRKTEKEQPKVHRIHIVTRIIGFVRNRIYMNYLRCCKRNHFIRARQKQEAAKYTIDLLDEGYNANISIEEIIKQSQNKIKAFSNDVLKEKFRQKTNKNFVRVLWTTIGVICMLIIITVVASQRNKVSIASEIGDGIRTLFTNFVGFSPTTLIKLDYLNSVAQLKIWITTSFPALIVSKNVTIQDSSGNFHELSGYFLDEYFYVINQEIGVTVRRKNASLNQNGKDLTIFCNVSLPAKFNWGASTPQANEFTGDIVGTTSNTTYHYAPFKPGYLNIINLTNSTTHLTQLIEDGLIDSSLNSILFEAALYHVARELPVYVQIVLTIDAAGNIRNNFKSLVLNTPKISGSPSSEEIFVYFLELVIVIAAIVCIYDVGRALKTKNDLYEHWYQLYINHFPVSVKNKREDMKPEFIRRLEFLLSGEIGKILFTIFLIVETALTAAVLVIEITLQQKLDSVIPSALATNPQPFPYPTEMLIQKLKTSQTLCWYLRLADSITLLIAVNHLVSQYSYNLHFYKITQTFKRVGSDLMYMIVIYVFILVGFAYFMLLTVGIYDSDFSNVFQGFRELLDSLTGLKDFNIVNIRSFKDLFISFIFFYPYTIIGKLILANVFIGIVYDSYSRSKKEAVKMEKIEMGLSEFFCLTKSMVCKKRKTITPQLAELSNEMNEMTNLHNIIDHFSGTFTENYSEKKDMKLWSTKCSQNILIEYEARKKIRKKVKEFATMHLDEEEDTLFPTHSQTLPPEHRVKKYHIREVYWNYFRLGVRKLMKYFKVLDKRVKQSQERVKIDYATQLKEETTEKLKSYITQLEAKIESNVSDLQEIRRVLRIHNIAEPQEDDDDMED